MYELDDVFTGSLDGFVYVDEKGYNVSWVQVKTIQPRFLGSLDRFIEFEAGSRAGVCDSCVPREGPDRLDPRHLLDLFDVFACAPVSPPRTVAG